MAASEKNILRKRIAAVNGLPPISVDYEELTILYRHFNLIGIDEKSEWVYNKYVGRHAGRARVEKSQQTFQLVENLLNCKPVTNSYGLFAPSYLHALEEQAEIRPLADGYRSLLVGALTPDTITEYAATVRRVYHGAFCSVVDIEGHDTRKISPDIARYVGGDALHLPFADGSFDSLHTNILLDQFGDVHTGRDQRNEFFSEAWRVLRPGGRLIMMEKNDYNGVVLGELQKAGFPRVTAEQAQEFISRRLMERYLGILPTNNKEDRDYKRNTDPSPEENLIVARKDLPPSKRANLT